jgi:hypothetical protein
MVMKWQGSFLQENSRLMLLSFEVFWIVIFLLDRLGTGRGIPPFVYVNF